MNIKALVYVVVFFFLAISCLGRTSYHF